MNIANEIADENMKEAGNEAYDCFSSNKLYSYTVIQNLSVQGLVLTLCGTLEDGKGKKE